MLAGVTSTHFSNAYLHMVDLEGGSMSRPCASTNEGSATNKMTIVGVNSILLLLAILLLQRALCEDDFVSQLR